MQILCQPFLKSDVNMNRTVASVRKGQITNIAPKVERLSDLLVNFLLGNLLGVRILGNAIRQIQRSPATWKNEASLYNRKEKMLAQLLRKWQYANLNWVHCFGENKEKIELALAFLHYSVRDVPIINILCRLRLRQTGETAIIEKFPKKSSSPCWRVSGHANPHSLSSQNIHYVSEKWTVKHRESLHSPPNAGVFVSGWR